MTEPELIRRNAIGLFADLEAYFRFVSQRDVGPHIFGFTDYVWDCLETVILGGKAFWTPGPECYEPLCTPIITKLIGDCLMCIFDANDFYHDSMIELCDRLRAFGKGFGVIVLNYAKILPQYTLPHRIKIGMAAGEEYFQRSDRSKLAYRDAPMWECAAQNLALAERLCSYCKRARPISFIASRRIPVSSSIIEDYGFIEAWATAIPDGENERVIIDAHDFYAIDNDTRQELFWEA